MLFSVIIPTYNRRDLLTRTLDSVWAQRFTDYEVIVVDDGSTDGTLEMLGSAPTRVRLLKQFGQGPGVARNLGAREAQGEYAAFLDSDDLWFPWTLDVFAGLIAKHERPSILAAKLVTFVNDEELAGLQEETVTASAHPDYFDSHQHSYFVGAGMSVIKRETFLAAGGYTDHPINYEDHDLMLRLGTTPGFVQVLSPVTVGWRRHAGSVTCDAERNLKGMLFLISQERAGVYPGGDARRTERRDIIARHARPASLGSARDGQQIGAWQIYLTTFVWHIATGRWKYLAVAPFIFLAGLVSRKPWPR